MVPRRKQGSIMPIVNRIAEFHPDMTAWRRDIHAHPETAFEEHRTSSVVAEKLEASAPRCTRAWPAPAWSAR
jgi:metal-dependent amidase/aminoacylase/carboxypeptidase family protein